MRILVSGAGMAGLAAGINLGATGNDVTIVERAGHLRVNGSPVDVRGDALGIARSMGILEQIHARRVTMTERAQFIDASGDVVAELPVSEISDSDQDIEIPREDLAHVLHEALTGTTSLIFAESIAELHDDGAGVEVTFTSGKRDRFDLVVGADGLHSLTRRLTFGPECDFLKHLGFYVALTELPSQQDSGRTSPFLSWPGHLIGIAHYNDTALGVLNFRSDWIEYDYRDLDAQKRILLDAFAGHEEWRVPEILDAVRSDPELYFDSVSQIHMPTWHKGRVVLVGDAAHCASNLSGRGASLAITGTWLLAQALLKHPENLKAAFDEYEHSQRPYVTRAQDSAGPGGDLLMPATQQALDERNERLRAMTRG
ncbi:FAD-dependent monooxygenase [Winogradskya humida]|uniref:Oxidoreductase n=1 Tax=Winogradskya humida TaxID=113566 RepID=A0ABQ3ZNA8_9ACTN|nr:FAD-dependent monooxygenase [Actinoplanes humidus]GIE20071.1 oxidoreductase [Actinoplanes humidus]